MKFKVGDIVTPKTRIADNHRIIGIDENRSVYVMERLGTDRVDEFEIRTVDNGGRKLTKLELALK